MVQKYIERPLLVGGRKFDIRAYALVAPCGRVFMHRASYARTSSSAFGLTDLADRRAWAHKPQHTSGITTPGMSTRVSRRAGQCHISVCKVCSTTYASITFVGFSDRAVNKEQSVAAPGRFG